MNICYSPIWRAHRRHIFSASREDDGVISASVAPVLWVQEEHKHHILTNGADVNTFSVFVSPCANHMFIVTELWVDNGFILLDGSQHSRGSETCRNGKIWGILWPSVICRPVLEVLSLPLLTSHWPLTPAVVLSGSPDLHSSDCLWVFLTWLYHFLLSVKYRKRWGGEKNNKKDC